jgi:vancomycin resistance protein YoaR
VLLPGEVYSVNETLGPRTATRGFTMAPTIVKGEMDDTVGGGISQFATTLFNAVLRGGYEIIERQPHSIYFSRYPMGHEATLSYPKPDLIFRNDTPSGMVIRTRYSGTFIKVMVFGDNNGRVVTTDVSKAFDSVEPAIEYIADPTRPPEEEEVEEKGDWGFTVYASRTVKEKDGTERTESRKVVYKPRARRLVVHPCKIPEGFEGFTGEKCPEPENSPDAG